MHAVTISRCVGGGSVQGPTLGGWVKSFVSKWFGGTKSVVIARPSTVPLSGSIAQSAQAPLLARWSFADRLNQYAERNRLIDVYTRQYRQYVMPSPRARMRGFGTLFSFVALTPALRNVDSKDADADEGTYAESWISEFAKRNTGLYEKGVQPQYDAGVSKFDELHILRRANAADNVSMLYGAQGVFIAERNRVVEATCCIEEVVESDIETQPTVVDHDDEVSNMEVVDIAESSCKAPNAGASMPFVNVHSDSDGFSVIEDEPEAVSNFVGGETEVSRDQPIGSIQMCRNEKSVLDEVHEVDGSKSSQGCDYSVIEDQGSQDQAAFLRYDASRVSADRLRSAATSAEQPAELANEPIVSAITWTSEIDEYDAMRSIGETVFKIDHERVHASCISDRELETRSKAKVKMRSETEATTAQQEMIRVHDRVTEWLANAHARSTSTFSIESATTDTSVASRDDALLRALHNTAEYLIYPFAGCRAIPRELLHDSSFAPHGASAWRLVAPHISVLRVPLCSVLSDQLAAAHAGPLGVGAASTSRVSQRARFANATGIIRSLCTIAALKRGSDHEDAQVQKELLLVVRQRPRSLRTFLRELELEILESRALSLSLSRSDRSAAQSCAHAFDSVVLQLLEFGWTALVADRLRFASFDFERLLDALGVEVDACGKPHVVLLGGADANSFGQLFAAPTPTLARTRTFELNAHESFASFAYVVWQNLDRVIEALELAGVAAGDFGARARLVRKMYAVREESVADLRAAMEQLREEARLADCCEV